jgi:hypothetical protein
LTDAAFLHLLIILLTFNTVWYSIKEMFNALLEVTFHAWQECLKRWTPEI